MFFKNKKYQVTLRRATAEINLKKKTNFCLLTESNT